MIPRLCHAPTSLTNTGASRQAKLQQMQGEVKEDESESEKPASYLQSFGFIMQSACLNTVHIRDVLSRHS